MNQFTPHQKMSKKKRREIDLQKRKAWGCISPVTRKPEKPKAYKRKKTRYGSDELSPNRVFLLTD